MKTKLLSILTVLGMIFGMTAQTITTKDDGYYAVSYHGLVGLLIEAVKELSEKVK